LLPQSEESAVAEEVGTQPQPTHTGRLGRLLG